MKDDSDLILSSFIYKIIIYSSDPAHEDAKEVEPELKGLVNDYFEPYRKIIIYPF